MFCTQSMREYVKISSLLIIHHVTMLDLYHFLLYSITITKLTYIHLLHILNKNYQQLHSSDFICINTSFNTQCFKLLIVSRSNNNYSSSYVKYHSWRLTIVIWLKLKSIMILGQVFEVFRTNLVCSHYSWSWKYPLKVFQWAWGVVAPLHILGGGVGGVCVWCVVPGVDIWVVAGSLQPV